MNIYKDNYNNVEKIINGFKGLPLICVSTGEYYDYNSILHEEVYAVVEDVIINSNGNDDFPLDDTKFYIKNINEEELIDNYLEKNENKYSSLKEAEEEAYKKLDNLGWEPMIVICAY
jgi:hypothetical protein